MVYEFDNGELEFHIWDADTDRITEAFKELARGMDRQEKIDTIIKDKTMSHYTREIETKTDEELDDMISDLDFDFVESEFEDFMYNFFEKDAEEEWESVMEYEADREAGMSYYYGNC